MSELKLVAPAYRLGSTVFGATLATTMAFSAASAEPPQGYDYIFGGYAYGGYTDLSGKGDFEGNVGRLTVGGRADLALYKGWRMAFIAEGTHDRGELENRNFDFGDNTFWGNSYTYTHLSEGTFAGVESGYRSHSEGAGGQNFWKIGAFGRYSLNDQWAFNAWGGALVPLLNDDDTLDTSFYAGGTVTAYLGDVWSVGGYTDWSVAKYENSDQEFHSLRAGLRATYLTSIEGVRVWGSGGYAKGWFETNGSTDFEFSGPEFRVGVSLDLFSGGLTPSNLKTFDDNTFNTPVYGLSQKF